MENEANINDLNLIESTGDDYNIFKIDYPNQNLDNNKEYQQWYNSMTNKYEKKTKILKCKKDNIYFCIENKRNYFYAKCPLCKKNLCIFCLNSKPAKYSNYNCCLKMSVNRCYLQGFLFIKNYTKIPNNGDIHGNMYYELYNENKCFHFIPGINLTILISRISEILYLYLGTKKSLNDNSKEFISYQTGLIPILKNIYFWFSCILSIPFFIYNFLFIIIFVLISKPFKNLPLNFLYGAIFIVDMQ